MTASNMIATLREISDIVTQTQGDAETIAKQLGTIDEKIFSQYEVIPKFDGLYSVTVVPQSMSAETNYVSLKLSESIALNDLKTAFGDYNQLPAMPNVPPKGLFEFNTSSKTHRATLIVQLDSPDIINITIRRDMIL